MKRERFDATTIGCKCDVCPLAGLARPVPPKGPASYRMVVFGEVPSRQDEMKGEPYSGRDGLTLEALFAKAEIDRKEVMLTHAVLCRPNILKGSWRDYEAHLKLQNRQEKKDAKREKRKPNYLLNPTECCRPHIDSIVKVAQATAKSAGRGKNAVIVPAGPAALQMLTGKVSVTRYRGSAIPWEKRQANENLRRVAVPASDPVPAVLDSGCNRVGGRDHLPNTPKKTGTNKSRLRPHPARHDVANDAGGRSPKRHLHSVRKAHKVLR